MQHIHGSMLPTSICSCQDTVQHDYIHRLERTTWLGCIKTPTAFCPYLTGRCMAPPVKSAIGERCGAHERLLRLPSATAVLCCCRAPSCPSCAAPAHAAITCTMLAMGCLPRYQWSNSISYAWWRADRALALHRAVCVSG